MVILAVSRRTARIVRAELWVLSYKHLRDLQGRAAQGHRKDTANQRVSNKRSWSRNLFMIQSVFTRALMFTRDPSPLSSLDLPPCLSLFSLTSIQFGLRMIPGLQVCGTFLLSCPYLPWLPEVK